MGYEIRMKREEASLTVQFKKGFRVELLRIQSVCLLPDFPQLSDTSLSIRKRKKMSKSSIHFHKKPPKNLHVRICEYRSVDFRVLAVFILQLLHPLLLFLSLLLVQALQVLPSLVLLQHLVALELLVPLCVVVLQILGGLNNKSQTEDVILKSKTRGQIQDKSSAWETISDMISHQL